MSFAIEAKSPHPLARHSATRLRREAAVPLKAQGPIRPHDSHPCEKIPPAYTAGGISFTVCIF